MLLKRESRELFRKSQECRGGGGLMAANYLWGFCTGRFEKPVQQEGIGNLGLGKVCRSRGTIFYEDSAQAGLKSTYELKITFPAAA